MSTTPSSASLPAHPLPPLTKMETLTVAGFSGMFGWVFTHPFEMWKNTVMMAPKGTSTIEGFLNTKKNGFYKGISSGLLRQVVYAPVRLGCYPIFRDLITSTEAALGIKKNNDNNIPQQPTIIERAIAGASAGVFASCLSSPIEVCLVVQTTSKKKVSLLEASGSVLKNNGVLGFWRGIGALASRAALVGVCQVAVHDQVLTTLRYYNHFYYNTANNNIPFSDNLVVNVASTITAFIYSFCTMPVEMVRVRMSSEARAPPGTEKKYFNVLQALSRIAREEGILTMYDSFLPYFARCTIHTVACFFAIEYITHQLRMSKSKKQIPEV